MLPNTDRAPRILCIDDQRLHVAVRKMLLEQAGCDVTVRYDSQSALDLLAREEFDLVLLDYHLGDGVDGEELANRVRELCPKLPIIMLTGDPNIPGTAGCTVNEYFVKGAHHPMEMIAAIQRLLPQHILRPRRRKGWDSSSLGRV